MSLAAALCTTAAAQDIIPVRTPGFEIEYRVDEAALPLSAVELWITRDRGATWEHFGNDEDRQSPFVLDDPGEGLIGLYLILRNHAGPSSQPPTPNTSPQLWAFVDFTPPVVQLHAPRLTTSLGGPLVQIRWTAVDAHFPARPIEIRFRPAAATDWQPVTPEPLANTGRFDWRVPEGLRGSIVLQLSARDEVGHVSTSEEQVIDLASFDPPPAAVPESNAALNTTQRGSSAMSPHDTLALPAAWRDPSDAAVSGSQRARDRAARLLAEAIALRDSGDIKSGVSRLREAVRLDPQLTDAFVEMGGLLYRLGDWDRALIAYDLALKQRPTDRAAHRGAAMVHTRLNDHATAAQHLRTVLRYNPQDAEIWLNLGDVAVYQGDEVLARECYLRASTIDPAATSVIEEADKRLNLLRQGEGSRGRRP